MLIGLFFRLIFHANAMKKQKQKREELTWEFSSLALFALSFRRIQLQMQKVRERRKAVSMPSVLDEKTMKENCFKMKTGHIAEASVLLAVPLPHYQLAKRSHSVTLAADKLPLDNMASCSTTDKDTVGANQLNGSVCIHKRDSNPSLQSHHSNSGLIPKIVGCIDIANVFKRKRLSAKTENGNLLLEVKRAIVSLLAPTEEFLHS